MSISDSTKFTKSQNYIATTIFSKRKKSKLNFRQFNKFIQIDFHKYLDVSIQFIKMVNYILYYLNLKKANQMIQIKTII